MTRRAGPSLAGPTSGRTRAVARRSGFTLIEMLAVLGFTALLMLFAANFYLEITRSSETATERTRGSRRAVAVLDRIARDLEAAVLVKKPEDVDPLSHPWLFLAEDRGGSEGADHLKFTTRSRIPRSTALHESDYEVVAYFLREGEEGGVELLRWSSPRLPEELDRSFPASEMEGALLFAGDLASFGVRFMDEESEWKSEWDSSTLVDSSELPLAAEISLAILPEGDRLDEEEPEVYLRRVLLPVRPLDLEALLGASTEADAEEEEEDEECVTVSECLERNGVSLDELRDSDPGLYSSIDSILGFCFSEHADSLPMALEDCE